MYTLMKSERVDQGISLIAQRSHEQKVVARFHRFEDAVAACEEANRDSRSRHYVMNPDGQEYFQQTWID